MDIFMVNYLKLFRQDVAAIAFFSYLTGCRIAGRITLTDIIIAGAVTLISTNFIYSFNSWTDRDIDRVNKPWRPVPSGKIKPSSAMIYSIILLVISCIYPFFIFKNHLTLSLFLLMPFLGIIYSAPPLRLRKYSIPAVIIISAGLTTPISLGYFMNSSHRSIYPFFITIFIYCLFIVPLKDIEDRDGDLKYGMENLYEKFGGRLIDFCLLGLLTDLLLVIILNINLLFKIFLIIIIITPVAIIIFWRKLGKNLNNLYQTLIYTVILEGFVLYIILNYCPDLYV